MLVAKDVEGADTGGADRALGVVAALRLMPPGRPGLVVSCGTAITVERITSQGVWQGGAIAPGLGVMASALHIRTAQLPLLDTRQLNSNHSPPAWGRGTVASLTAGIFWGTVGLVRELVRVLDCRRARWRAVGNLGWGAMGHYHAPYVCGEDAKYRARSRIARFIVHDLGRQIVGRQAGFAACRE